MEDLMKETVRPSQVFLELWQAVTSLDCELPAEDFARYAQAWRQIVSLEEIYAEAKRQERTLEKFESWAKELMLDGEGRITSGPAGAPAPTPGTRDGKDPSPAAQDDGGPGGSPAPTGATKVGQTYDCASAPMPDPEEVTRANRSAGGKAGFATRKRNLTERLEGLRRDGHKLHEIAEAVPGLTINDVMDGLNAKTLTPMKIQALERACRKLEEADSGGG